MDSPSIVSTWGLDPDLLKQRSAYYTEIWCKGYPGNRPALIVPTGQDTRARAIFLDGKLPKYNWLPGDKRPHPVVFDPAGILASNPQRVILTNGDKTTLLLDKLGIPAISTFGEGNQASQAAACLSAAGVRELVNYPDSDLNAKGVKAAHKWLTVGFEAGIEVVTLDYGQWLINQFGGDLAAYDGWDLRDLYLKLDQDRARFLAALENIQPIQWERYSALLPKVKNTPYTSTGTEDLPAQFLLDVKTALGIEETYNSDGFTRKAVKCPLKNHAHDDVAPAAYWHEDHFLKCHKCHSEGETANAKTVGAALNLHLRDYYQQPATPDQAPWSGVTLDSNIERYHFKTIPDLLRKSLMGFNQQFEQYEDQTPALICLETIYEAIQAGDLDPAKDVITRRWLAGYGKRAIKETTARTGLEQLAALGFMTRIAGSTAAQYKLLPLVDGLDNYRRIMTAQYRQQYYSERPSRRVTEYGEIIDLEMIPHEITPEWIALESPEMSQEQLVHGAEVLNQYRAELYQDFTQERTEAAHKLQNQVRKLGAIFSLEGLLTAPSTPLATDDTWQNSSAYRASFYRARVQWRLNRQITITQKQAAEELGISPKSLYSLRQKHGITLDEQFEEISVQAPAAVFEVMPGWAARRDYGNEVVSSSGKRISATRAADRQAVKKWVASEIRSGHRVILRLQTGSQERFATPEERAAMETKIETQSAAARARRMEYQNRQRKTEARLKLEKVAIALRETVIELDPHWVKAQLDLRPGWELLLDGLELGAVINLQELPIEEKPRVSSIGNFRNLPERAARSGLAPFQPAQPPASRTQANRMRNFPDWEATTGNL